MKRAAKKFITLLVGTIVLFAGLIMLVTPGPGLVFLYTGLAILATEFEWAKRLAARFKEHTVDRIPQDKVDRLKQWLMRILKR